MVVQYMGLLSLCDCADVTCTVQIPFRETPGERQCGREDGKYSTDEWNNDQDNPCRHGVDEKK